MIQSGRLVVISGPSAVGKGTVVSYIVRNYSGFDLSVSTTTRPPRPGEVEGDSYFFVDNDEFSRLIEGNKLLEWATVHGVHRYGTPRDAVQRLLQGGSHVLLEIDVQGALQVKATFPESTLIFIQPPSFEDLEARMENRGTETADDRLNRLETARVELNQADFFDFRVVNHQVDQCAKEVVDLVKSN